MKVHVYVGTCSECGRVYKVFVVTEESLESPISLRCHEWHETAQPELVYFGLEEVV